jgi:hypothetical protein
VTPSSNRVAALLGLAGLLLSGCSSLQSTAFPAGDRHYPPKPPAAAVQVFMDTLPTRKFEAVAKLNVHIEKTFFIPSAFAEARPKLEDLARQHGADAIIQIAEKKSRLNETFIYNVTATAVVFTD